MNAVTVRSPGVARRAMTRAERRSAAPRFPWNELALAPVNGVLAAVPATVIAGLPLFIVLWLADVNEPGRWVSLVTVGAFTVASAAALYTCLGGFLRARARVDDDLLDGVVEDRVVEVSDAIEIATDPPAIYLQLAGDVTGDGGTLVLTGDYLTRLRRTGCFPSTRLRLVQLPRSRAVLGLLPLGDAFRPAVVSGTEHGPGEFDGETSRLDFNRLRARAYDRS